MRLQLGYRLKSIVKMRHLMQFVSLKRLQLYYCIVISANVDLDLSKLSVTCRAVDDVLWCSMQMSI